LSSGEAFDLAVIGAGPAGSAAALEGARRGLSVVLFDPLDADADLPCGEGVLAEGVAALRELGVALGAAKCVALRALRYRLPDGLSIALPFPRDGLALPRPRLASALAAAISGMRVERVFERAVLASPDGAGLLRLEHGGRVTRARTVVLADGTEGAASSALRPPGYASGRFGLRARFAAARPLDAVEVHLGGRGEVYLTPLAGGLVNAAFLFEHPPEHAGPVELVELALEAAPRARAILGELVTPPRGRRLDRLRPPSVCGAGAFLAGDAGAAVDPILGCGVSIALRTGRRAARSAAELLAGAPAGAVERAYAQALARECRFRRGLARALRELARRPRVLGLVGRLAALRPAALEPLVRRAALGPG
jgi:flavin-dependent dehydrogenase